LQGILVVVVAARDWRAWHDAYAQPGSDLSRRLRLLQGELSSWLDERPGEALTVVSVCAGQGHDLLGVLAARQAGLRQVEIVQADAGELSTYDGLVPADLVLLAGVFGNISDADVRRTIGALPQLCARRHRPLDPHPARPRPDSCRPTLVAGRGLRRAGVPGPGGCAVLLGSTPIHGRAPGAFGR